VGGALFALRFLRSDCARQGAPALLHEARERTHPLSARLLADLAAGEGWAPLHDLVAALGADDRALITAARSLVALGHSSGWDLLAGVLTAVLGPDALAGAGGTRLGADSPADTGTAPRGSTAPVAGTSADRTPFMIEAMPRPRVAGHGRSQGRRRDEGGSR
jgi:hypothetical protein